MSEQHTPGPTHILTVVKDTFAHGYCSCGWQCDLWTPRIGDVRRSHTNHKQYEKDRVRLQSGAAITKATGVQS